MNTSTATCTLFCCGDVMTGRGIDQILPQPVAPELHEAYVKDARRYVTLAEEANGEIAHPVDRRYIWGDALPILDQTAPDLRLVNLETSVTTSDDYWRAKGIHYRMHPGNMSCLTTAAIHCCALANNHVLDWGHAGLAETIEVLRGHHIQTAGAGLTADEARAPAVFEHAAGKRIAVFACAMPDAGVPPDWAAGPHRPGVYYVDAPSTGAADELAAVIRERTHADDLVVLAVHWGSNWGYDIDPGHVAFAHALVDAGAVDLVCGHSSHHVRPFEVYRNKLILYGCGDFLNDYEGISGHERYRGDLTLMYFPKLDAASGDLQALEMVPLKLRRLRLETAAEPDVVTLRRLLNETGEDFGTRVDRRHDRLYWSADRRPHPPAMEQHP